MLVLATSEAVAKDIGLGATFLGIGLVVNIIVIYIAIQIRGERRQNKEYLSTRHITRV
jgi:acid phosphatase family membrane protein YuiD